jgi:hypothetical protein
VKNLCVIYGYSVHEWQTVVHDLFQRIQTSGLAEELHTIQLITSLHYTGEIPLPKGKVLMSVDQSMPYEYPALNYIYDLRNDFDNVLYLHTKGISRREPEIMPNVRAWRDYMAYFCVDRWLDRLKALELFDVSGCQWQMEPWPHFSGNFWWARMSHIRKLPHPKTLPALAESMFPNHAENLKQLDIRMMCERWIGMEPCGYDSAFYSSKNLYLQSIHPDEYKQR